MAAQEAGPARHQRPGSSRPCFSHARSPCSGGRRARRLGIQGVAAVHHELRLAASGRPRAPRSRAAHLLPLRDHHRRVRPLERLVGVEDDLELGHEPSRRPCPPRGRSPRPARPGRPATRAISRLGAPRRSSVFGLKESPSSATRLPFRVCSSRWSLAITRLRCRSLTATAASSRAGSCSYSRAIALRAETSLGKHEPPQPMPAVRKREPMRSSRPMPSPPPSRPRRPARRGWRPRL